MGRVKGGIEIWCVEKQHNFWTNKCCVNFYPHPHCITQTVYSSSNPFAEHLFPVSLMHRHGHRHARTNQPNIHTYVLKCKVRVLLFIIWKCTQNRTFFVTQSSYLVHFYLILPPVIANILMKLFPVYKRRTHQKF